MDLQPHTTEAFDRYVRGTGQRFDSQVRGDEFPWANGSPARKSRLLAGEVTAEPIRGNGETAVPDGVIHDWYGAVFIRGATLAKTLAVAQDYDSHARLYAPELQASKTLGRNGDEFDIYLRLLKTQIITVVLNTNHHVQYFPLDARRCYSVSHSTRIAEVVGPGEPGETEMSPGHDHGFLWRLNSYWFFEERDGGVYVESEAVSLTRAVPAGFGWLINPIVRTLPRDSLQNTLRSFRTAVIGG